MRGVKLCSLMLAAALALGSAAFAQQQQPGPGPGQGQGRPSPQDSGGQETSGGQRQVCGARQRLSVRGECERIIPDGGTVRPGGILGALFGRPQPLRIIEIPAAPAVAVPAPRKPKRPVRVVRIPIPTPRPDFPQDTQPSGPLAQQVAAQDFVPDEVLVTIEGDAAIAESIAGSLGLQVRSVRVSGLLGATVVRYGIPDGRSVAAVLGELEADGRTLERVPNHIYALQQAVQIVHYGFQRIALDAEEASGADIEIAVIDTAADETHPALKEALAGQFDAMPDTEVKDRDHGTSISGLIAGSGPFRGMAPGARLYHARAFEGGRSNTDVLLAALDWAAGEGVHIVNMSFVGPENRLFELACENAQARGIVLVAAAGNNGPGAPHGYPAAYESVIAVTATDERDQLMEQANRGAYVDISAPGVNVLAPIPGGTDAVTGTSFAAAIVSGAIANLMRQDAALTPQALSALLTETAVDLGAPGRDDDFGYGLLNASAARERGGAIAQTAE